MDMGKKSFSLMLSTNGYAPLLSQHSVDFTCLNNKKGLAAWQGLSLIFSSVVGVI
jgi:hypothetical protein